MNYEKFQELCEACYVAREVVEEIYGASPDKPWSSGNDYAEDNRVTDATHFFNEVFGVDGELDMTQLSSRVATYRERLQNEGIKGGIWATIGNIRTAIAKAAAKTFIAYLEVLPDQPQLDAEQIREQGKPSPYGNMQFPNFVQKPDGGFTMEGTHPADHEAAEMMYDGNYLALLIAREYDMEDCLP